MATKLLLADDSITIQKVVGIIFANEDYDLTVVGNGFLALEKAREILPEVMLVDVLMPGKNGYEVCQEVRNDEHLKSIPLLLLTGAFEPFDENMARQCGADDFISKPFESQHLLEKVKELLELARHRIDAISPVVDVVPPPLNTLGPVYETPSTERLDERIQEIKTPFSPNPETVDDNLSAAEPVSFKPVSADLEEPISEGIEVVEAEPGDDPWGIFDLIDLEEPEPLHDLTQELSGPEPSEPDPLPIAADAIPEMEPKESPDFAIPLECIPEEGEEESADFAYELEDIPEPGAEESTDFAVELIESHSDTGVEVKREPVEETSFTYQDEEPTPSGETFTICIGEPLAMLANEPEQFSATTLSEPEEVTPPADRFSSECIPEVPEEPAAPAQMAVIGEEQLRAILSQISRDIIEKIVWEVVPDLAESLIKEEIRNLKQGIEA